MSSTDPAQPQEPQVPPPTPPSQPPTPPAVPPMGQPPVGPPGGYPPGAYPSQPGPAQFQPAPAYAAPVQESSSSKSTVALVLGIGGFFFGLLTGIPAIIVGMMARKQAKRLGEPTGMATAGIVLGWIFTIVSIVSLILFLMLGVFVSKNAPAIVDNAQTLALKSEAVVFASEYGTQMVQANGMVDVFAQNDAADQAKQTLERTAPNVTIKIQKLETPGPLGVAMSDSISGKCVTFTMPELVDIGETPVPTVVVGPSGTVATGGGSEVPTCS